MSLDLLSSSTVAVPTVHDAFSARLAVEAGFTAVFLSGYGTAASMLGQPDNGLIPLSRLAAHTRAVCGSVSVPVLVDADTGGDDPADCIRALAAAGAAAVMLEDQVADSKRCGHLAGKQVRPSGEMREVLAAASGAKPSGLLLIGRTDAIAPLGFDEAVRRGNAYAEAGADMIFVEAPETLDQVKQLPRLLAAPAMINLIPDGRTPCLDLAQLTELGYGLVVYGLIDLMIAGAALRDAFTTLRTYGDLGALGTSPRLRFDELGHLTGNS